MMFWCFGVLCLVALIGGAQACCEPDSYSYSYTGTVSGVMPNGPTGGGPTNFDGTYTSVGAGDYTTGNSRQAFSGIVNIPFGESEMPVAVTLDTGIIDGKKLWIKADVPMFGLSRCWAINIKGGIPKSYQCMTDFYKEVSDKVYSAPNQNEMVSEEVTVTDDCIIKTADMSISIPNGPSIKVTGRLTESDLSLENFESPKIPDDCHASDQEIELPPLDENSPGFAGLVMAGFSGPREKRHPLRRVDRALVNDGLRRLVRELEKAVKRGSSK